MISQTINQPAIQPDSQPAQIAITGYQGAAPDFVSEAGAVPFYIDKVRKGAVILGINVSLKDPEQLLVTTKQGVCSALPLEDLFRRVEQYTVWNKRKPVTYAVTINFSPGINSTEEAGKTYALLYSLVDAMKLARRVIINV